MRCSAFVTGSLLGFGVAIVVALMSLVGFQLVFLRRRLKARIFGSKLTLRLVIVFTIVSVLPGVVMYGISVQFLAGSIESWFDVRVDSALESGLNLGRVNLETGLRELQRKADRILSNRILKVNVSSFGFLFYYPLLVQTFIL